MIPNGVSDPERFKSRRVDRSRRASLGIRDNEVVILLARRLVEKNGVVMVRTSHLYALQGAPVRVIVAGDGDRAGRDGGRSLSENGMLDRTIFLGSVPNTEMPDLYRAADLSVLPSLAEATSIAGLEAMATGLPLVPARDVGGIPTIIEDNATRVAAGPAAGSRTQWGRHWFGWCLIRRFVARWGSPRAPGLSANLPGRKSFAVQY